MCAVRTQNTHENSMKTWSDKHIMYVLCVPIRKTGQTAAIWIEISKKNLTPINTTVIWNYTNYTMQVERSLKKITTINPIEEKQMRCEWSKVRILTYHCVCTRIYGRRRESERDLSVRTHSQQWMLNQTLGECRNCSVFAMWFHHFGIIIQVVKMVSKPQNIHE